MTTQKPGQFLKLWFSSKRGTLLFIRYNCTLGIPLGSFLLLQKSNLSKILVGALQSLVMLKQQERSRATTRVHSRVQLQRMKSSVQTEPKFEELPWFLSCHHFQLFFNIFLAVM